MILSIELEQIISEISEELNIPKVKIRYVILSMFKFLSNTVRSASTGEAETYKCVIIKNLGKFRKNRKVLRKFKERTLKNNQIIDGENTPIA